jgi:hypothetical protein
MANSQARKQRRSYELWLKKNNIEEYKKWKALNQLRGRTIHQENVELVQKAEAERLEKLQNEKIREMKKRGMSNEEIDRHIEIWVKTLKLWGTHEKPLSWKEAEREWASENTKS